MKKNYYFLFIIFLSLVFTHLSFSKGNHDMMTTLNNDVLPPNKNLDLLGCQESHASATGNSLSGSWGQSFIACETGVLSSLEIVTNNTVFSGTLTIFEGAGLGGVVLGFIDMSGVALTNSGGDTSIYSTIDVSGENINLTSGNSYTFNFSSAGSIYYDTTGGYSNGIAYNNGAQISFFDALFKANIVTPATVETTAATNIMGPNATLGGNVTDDGDGSVSDRGVVYSVTTTNASPTIGGAGVTQDANGTGTGVFSEIISGLLLNTEYSFRSYATNEAGTVYGTVLTFTSGSTNTNVFDGSTDLTWNIADNWSLGTVPDNTVNAIIGNFDVIIEATTGAEVNDLAIDPAGSLTVVSNATDSGSLIATGTVSGNIIYQRHVNDTDWHLIAAPVTSQSINDFATNAANNINTNRDKYAIGDYNNVTIKWEYFTTTTAPVAGNFISGQGYSFNRTAAGIFTFEGDMATEDVQVLLTTASGDHYWHIIGNPFPSFLPVNNSADVTNILNLNIGVLDQSFVALYLWDGSNYIAYNHLNPAFYLSPGQAFFIKTADESETFTFPESMQNHQTGADNFHRDTNSIPAVTINLSDENINRTIELKYVEGTSKGLDIGYDAGLFQNDGILSLATHLIEDSKGQDFMLQALPADSYNATSLPLSVYASAKTLTFSATTSNFPEGVNVYIEDIKEGTINKINNSSYQVTLDKTISGIGRFYLHTAVSELSIGENDFDTALNVYKTDGQTLRVTGLNSETTAILKIHTITGQEILTKQLEAKRINDIVLPESLRRGIYLTQVISNNKNFTKKIIIE